MLICPSLPLLYCETFGNRCPLLVKNPACILNSQFLQILLCQNIAGIGQVQKATLQSTQLSVSADVHWWLANMVAVQVHKPNLDV